MKLKLLLSCGMGLASLALVSCSEADFYGAGAPYGGGPYSSYGPYDSYSSYGRPSYGLTTYIFSSATRSNRYPYHYRGRYFHDHKSALRGYREPSRHYDYRTRKPYNARYRNNHRNVVNTRGRHEDRHRYKQSPIVQRQTRPGYVNPRVAASREKFYRQRGAVNPSVKANRAEYYRNRGRTSPDLNSKRERSYRQRQNAVPQRQNPQSRPNTRPPQRNQQRQRPQAPRTRQSRGNTNNLVNARSRGQNTRAATNRSSNRSSNSRTDKRRGR